MKRCGHMFREKLPFSDLWTELRKVATLKRKVGLLPAPRRGEVRLLEHVLRQQQLTQRCGCAPVGRCPDLQQDFGFDRGLVGGH